MGEEVVKGGVVRVFSGGFRKLVLLVIIIVCFLFVRDFFDIFLYGKVRGGGG